MSTAIAAGRGTDPGTVVRADIQGLRAIAVGVVLLFHLWPDRLPGGYVGVDVFFVISGFLITSHLLHRPPRSGGDLLEFWSRRIRRLLPASLLVLSVITVATWAVAPEPQWGNAAKEIAASALYVVNWYLASSSVDYLGAENAPTAAQHFWSLSVEEQFYLVWPLLIGLLTVIALRRRWPLQTVVGAGLGIAVATSLAYSVIATAQVPASAYFVTPTRMWELGIGGLLAVFLSRRAFGRVSESEAVPLPQPWRVLLAWAGLAAIVLAAVVYSPSTPFPGYTALLPVLGAGALIAAHAPLNAASPARYLAVRPMQWLGDVSYSVYLWHWPLIVLVPYALGHPLRTVDKLVILVATLLLAGVTKILVEDPFRTPGWGRPLRKPYLMAAGGMAVVVVLAGVLQLDFARHQEIAREELADALEDGGDCFGAAALAAGEEACPRTLSGPIVPAPAQAAQDRSDAYDGPCWTWKPFDETRTCTFGDPNGNVEIALVGNSHAGHWLPALQRLAEHRGWRITTFLASECTATRAPVEWETEELTPACLGWADRVLEATSTGRFDLVVTAERNGRAAQGHAYEDSQEAWVEGYNTYLAEWAAADVDVLVIHDTPLPGRTLDSVPDCLAQHPDDFTPCAGPRAEWVPDDALVAAARDLADARIGIVDLNDYICGAEVCDPAVGGVTVYFDASHVTATYMDTLARFLLPAIEEAIARSVG